MSLMRDAFIDELFEQARVDKKIIFLSADFGAAALDKFRAELSEQFIHTGISEQNMVDIGAGFAISGKKPVLYAMAPFLLHRAYEQIKSVVSAMNLPITFVSVGCGLGYDHATFTHFTPEDVAIAKCLSHMEVWTCSDSLLAAELSRHVIRFPRLRYIRLERNFLPDLELSDPQKIFREGFREYGNTNAKISVITSGYLTHKAIKVMKANPKSDISVIDLIRIKPLSNELLLRLNNCKKIITLEEQLLEGGIGSGIIEALSDREMLAEKKIKRMGLLDGFDVFNGDRDYLHESYGLSEKALEQVLLE